MKFIVYSDGMEIDCPWITDEDYDRQDDRTEESRLNFSRRMMEKKVAYYATTPTASAEAEPDTTGHQAA